MLQVSVYNYRQLIGRVDHQWQRRCKKEEEEKEETQEEEIGTIRPSPRRLVQAFPHWCLSGGRDTALQERVCTTLIFFFSKTKDPTMY